MLFAGALYCSAHLRFDWDARPCCARWTRCPRKQYLPVPDTGTRGLNRPSLSLGDQGFVYRQRSRPGGTVCHHLDARSRPAQIRSRAARHGFVTQASAHRPIVWLPYDMQGGPPFVHELSKRLVPDYDVHVLTPYCTGSKSSDTMDGVTILRFRYLPPGVSDLTGGGGIMDNLNASPLNYVKVLPLLLVYSFKLTQLLLGNSRRSIVVHAHWSIPQGVLAACAKWTIPVPFKVLCTVNGSDVMGCTNPQQWPSSKGLHWFLPTS